MAPISQPHRSFHHPPGSRLPGCAALRLIAVHLICGTKLLHLFYIVPSVKPRIQEVRCLFTQLFSCSSLMLALLAARCDGELLTKCELCPSHICEITAKVLSKYSNSITCKTINLAGLALHCTWERHCEARFCIRVQIKSDCGKLRRFMFAVIVLCGYFCGVEGAI